MKKIFWHVEAHQAYGQLFTKMQSETGPLLVLSVSRVHQAMTCLFFPCTSARYRGKMNMKNIIYRHHRCRAYSVY